jgi:hypothetical protein
MMHGYEKSDPAIVAVKPANKAERSAAELVERRAGTEGNAVWQSTHWTQRQVRVAHRLIGDRDLGEDRRDRRGADRHDRDLCQPCHRDRPHDPWSDHRDRGRPCAHGQARSRMRQARRACCHAPASRDRARRPMRRDWRRRRRPSGLAHSRARPIRSISQSLRQVTEWSFSFCSALLCFRFRRTAPPSSMAPAEPTPRCARRSGGRDVQTYYPGFVNLFLAHRS